MASFTLVTSLPKFGHAGATIARARPWNTRVFAAATPRPIQVPKSHNEEGSVTVDGIKQGQGVGETVNNSINEPILDKAYSTSKQAVDKTKEGANQTAGAAQNIAEKAKQTMQEAWDSTKNTANKALGKSQESWDSTKDTANRAADTVVGKSQEAWDSTKDTTNRAADTMLGESQESWDSTKDTANRAADTVVGKTQQSADYVKDNAETVKKNMNNKN